MGFLTDGEPVRLVLKPGFWVDLKPQLSADEEGQAKRALAMFTVSGNQATGEPDVSAYQKGLVSAAIVSWNLTDSTDTPLPLSPPGAKNLAVTVTSVGRLPGWALAKLVAKVEELNAEPTAEESAVFQPGVDGSDPVGAGVSGAGSAADANGSGSVQGTGGTLVETRNEA